MHLLGALGKYDQLALDLLDAAHALLRLRGLGGLVAELVDKNLHVGDLSLLRRALGAHLLEVVLALAQVVGVVARIGGEAAVLDGRHVGDAGVHEGAVVAHEEHGAVIGSQEVLEPLDALEVEVVGGLVQKEQVGMAKQELGERNAHLPAAGEISRGLVKVLDGKAQAAQDLACTGIQLVAAETLEAVLGVAVVLKQAVQLGTGLRGRDLCLELGYTALPALHLVRGVNNLLKGGLLAIDLGLLLQVANGCVLGKGDGALVGGLLAHDDLQERGLAGAVGANQGPTLPPVELECGLRVKDPSAKRLGDLVCECYHMNPSGCQICQGVSIRYARAEEVCPGGILLPGNSIPLCTMQSKCPATGFHCRATQSRALVIDRDVDREARNLVLKVDEGGWSRPGTWRGTPR